MNRRILSLALLLAALVPAVFPLGAGGQTPEPLALARVEVTGPIDAIGLPVYAHLLDSASKEYVLVLAAPSRLKLLKFPCTILDPDARGAAFLVGTPRRPQTRRTVASLTSARHDDGRHLILRADRAQADLLAGAGLDIQWLDQPLVLSAPQARAAEPFTTSSLVAAMIAQVDPAQAIGWVGILSGEQPAAVGGAPYTFTTRATQSGTPIGKATQYLFEYLEAQGLSTTYHDWTSSAMSGRNVVAEKPGMGRPSEIVLITAHLDDAPFMGAAPGADDNASGVSGVMTAAGICAKHRFQRTLRFVLFTGEEQGLLGSGAYAQKLRDAGENIVAVLNLDMIAWDGIDGPILQVHTRTANNPGYAADMEIAALQASVVQAYGLNGGIVPLIRSDGESASDHSSFWGRGYAGVLMIENYPEDFSPYYHTSNDRLSALNLIYFGNAVQVAVGMAAHLALPSPPPAGVPDSLRLWEEE